MAYDWLLVETLGEEPAVVAQGREPQNLVPITTFLRRSPYLTAIQMAIAESVQTGQPLASITPNNRRVIRAEPVKMSDGRVHGVHIWCGPTKSEPPERPLPGPLKFDVTLGVATDTPQSMVNAGRNPEEEATQGMAFADDLPVREMNPNENKVLELAIRAEAGQTLCSSWDLTDWQGNAVKLNFVVRTGWEGAFGAREHLVTRGMNWRGEPGGTAAPPEVIAQRILHGFAQPGVHRFVVGLDDWQLLKWLDEPAPLLDWEGTVDAPPVHPDDAAALAQLTAEFATGPAAALLRLRRTGGGWVPMQVMVNRVEFAENEFVGLVGLRAPTDDELAEAGLSEADAPSS